MKYQERELSSGVTSGLWSCNYDKLVCWLLRALPGASLVFGDIPLLCELVGPWTEDLSASFAGIASSFIAMAAMCSIEACVASVTVGIGTGGV